MATPFSFIPEKTAVSRAARVWALPWFSYAGSLSQLFFYLLAAAVAFEAFVGALSGWVAVDLKVPFVALFLFLLFFECYLFSELKIKNPRVAGSLAEAEKDPSRFNLAEFLSLEAYNAVADSMAVCKKMKLAEISSEALLYSAIGQSGDCRLLLFRLGFDAGKLRLDAKNYLEKQERNRHTSPVFSTSFKMALAKAAEISVANGKDRIGDQELLVALAEEDGLFARELVSQEVKARDVQSISHWLETVEAAESRRKKFWAMDNLLHMGSLGQDFAAGFTVMLDQYSLDLRTRARNRSMGGIVGHEKEIRELENILAKSSQSNVLVVGTPGSGRKSIVQALAEKCYLGTSLPELNSKRVVELDMVQLVSRVQDAEKMEAVLDQIFREALAAGNVILAIDQLDNFVGQRDLKPGQVDVSVILAKYLAMPSFQFIGITSFDGLTRKLEQESAFLDYFSKVEVVEISEEETLQVLQDAAIGFEQAYRLLILYPALREVVNLTGRYFPSTPFPKKAIDVLAETVSYARSQKAKVVTPQHVAQVVSEKAQVPVGKMEFKEKNVLLNLENLIHERIVNQQEAVSEISIAMRRARAGLGSKKRPMGVFLFLGPTGVGKTETAKALAAIYFGGEDKMVRLDMSEFQSVADIPRLIGAISPVEQQGLLTTPVREKPFSLVLLDEMEKAHPNILNLFLQVFDEGHLTDGQGRKVIFTNTIIVCTSNALADEIFRAVESGHPLAKETMMDRLFEKGIFKPEFVNRFDAAVMFSPLSREHLLQIAQLMLASLAKNLKEKDIALVITEPLKEKIMELSYKPQFGAREMRRVVQDNIENKLAQALLADEISKGDTVEINPENFEIVRLQTHAI